MIFDDAVHGRQRRSHRRPGGGHREGRDQLPGVAVRQPDHQRPRGHLQRLGGLSPDAAIQRQQRAQPSMHMMRMRMRTIGRHLRDESGVTVLLALFVLTLTTLILGAVYQAVTNDTQGTRLDLDQSRAYAAAQAGIAQYTYQLNQNPNYWQGCPTSGTPGNPTKVAVPNSTDGGSTEYYSYKPAPCDDRAAQRPEMRHGELVGHDDRGRRQRGPRDLPHPVHRSLKGNRHKPGRPDHTFHRRRVQATELPQLRLLHRLRDARPGRPVQREQQPDRADRLRGPLQPQRQPHTPG